MPAGNGPGFPDDQKAWIMQHVPEYLAKTSYGKARTSGLPPPKDDSDLMDWVRLRRNEFELAFKDALEASIATKVTTAKEIRAKFDAKFRNEKSKLKGKVNASIASASTATQSSMPLQAVTVQDATALSDAAFLWNKLIKGTAINGRLLFDQERRAIVNSEINATRKQRSIGHQQHAGMLNARLKIEWEQLGNQQQEWEEKAALLKSAEKDGLLYRNQAAFRSSLLGLLGSLIGPVSDGNYKIGNGRFHVLYAYRDEDETLKTGCLDIADEALGQVPFEVFNAEYGRVMEAWLECSKVTVTHNRPQNKRLPQPEFDVDSTGIPLFPAISEDAVTPDELRQILIRYIQTQWKFAHTSAGHFGSVPPIPWTDDYVPSLLSAPFHKLRNPTSLGIIDLYQLLSSIQSHQNLATGIKLFTIPSSSKSATAGAQSTPPTDNPQVPSPSHSLPAPVSPSQSMSPLPSLSPSPSRSLSPLPSATKAVSTAPIPINVQSIIQEHQDTANCTPTVPTASQPNIEKEKHNKRKADSTADSTNNTASPLKKKRSIATPQTIPESSRRSNRVRKPQHSGDDAHHVQTIGNSKPVKPALTRSGKVAKGWVVADSESDGY